MKKTYFIVMVVALALLAGCVVDYEDFAPSVGTKSDAVTVIGRVTSFSDYNVTSRGVKEGDEGKITSMAMAIFPVNDNGTALAGNCVYYQYADNQAELLFTIERGTNYTYNKRYAMYVFANMPGMEPVESGDNKFGVGSTLDEMLAKAYTVEDLDVPEDGFPMIGSLGDTFSTNFDKDDQVFILSPLDANDELTAPTVDGTIQTLLTIPMKAMYAKINFTIKVTPDQAIQGNYSSQFSIQGYKVRNIPRNVDFTETTNSDTDVIEEINGGDIVGNTTASGASEITFSFYLPERLLEPALQAHDGSKHGEDGYYEYPFTPVEGKYRNEDLDYQQRHKSKLVETESKKATNIEISGRFRDHQNHYWDVKYTIYLGANNFSDFNIKRNSEYNNHITIRGIKTSADMSPDASNYVVIDHRVNITRSQPAIISLLRETLLDSHFEVRPLRLKSSGIEGIDDITAVKVEVLNPNETNWLRLERSAGVGTEYASEDIYITEGVSAGKRKYFTYNLVSGKDYNGNSDDTGCPLNNSTVIVMPLIKDVTDDCVWIYADECLETGDAVRSGQIQVTYGSGTNETNFAATQNDAFPVVKYTINQRKLFPVSYGDETYNIEYHEEYLYNFDAYDTFGQTKDEGMAWGLSEVQLSNKHAAVFVSGGLSGDITDAINDIIKEYAYYDFYLSTDNTQGEKHDRQGWAFSKEIVKRVQGTKDNIGILDLQTTPSSAIEYCYNKNKRNERGEVILGNDTGWYLPAIDEIEDIVMSQYEIENQKYYSYARFKDFQNKFYWSSQPAYYHNNVVVKRNAGGRYGDYNSENTDFARATSVRFKGGDPDNPNNYEKIPSGMDGSYELLTVNMSGTFSAKYESHSFTLVTKDQEITWIDGGNWFQTVTEKISAPTYSEGYKHRINDKARVRCVRKLP